MSTQDFDLIIIGAGPAGCTLALKLAPLGIRIAIIEKEIFPRDKICGDALSGKVLNVLKRLPDNAYTDFIHMVDKVPSWGIRFVAPNLNSVDVPFRFHKDPEQPAPGFICTRKVFDTFLFDRLKTHSNIHIFQGEKVICLDRTTNGVQVDSISHHLHGRILAGADGVHSIARKFCNPVTTDKKHFCVGIRAYFENVLELHPENFIELIFLKSLLPGYFWIIPSADGMVNAGFALMKGKIPERKESMSSHFSHLIKDHPFLAPRFKNARQVSKFEAHTLPLGTFDLRRSGNRTLLLGDAAFLVDPFSGEGIGNAMASGEIAAEVLTNCFGTNDFSDETLQLYDSRIHRRIITEFRTSAMMQKLANSSLLFNLVVNKARRNEEIRNMLTAMFTDEDLKKKLTRPGFYFRVLFK
ncbi:MAG: geranylgeranyl reductase family protein [Bacteroidales bacterium]|jgi:geranylgeranyl reductase family protein|nr:geranylgeranyl reductase family protein [Bacteroidales bacterium]